jgi:hypothetical protein
MVATERLECSWIAVFPSIPSVSNIRKWPQLEGYNDKAPNYGSKIEQSKQNCELSSSHIHKSKLIMQVSQDSRDYTMNFLFSATFGKVSCIKVHLDGNLTQGKANQPCKD